MNKETTETIQYFKGKEKPESMIIVLDDDQLLKVISIFNLAVIDTKVGLKISKENDNTLWSSMWSNFEIDLDLFAISLGFGVSLTGRLVQRLIINRLVYPDNTINKFCHQFIARKIVNILRENT